MSLDGGGVAGKEAGRSLLWGCKSRTTGMRAFTLGPSPAPSPPCTDAVCCYPYLAPAAAPTTCRRLFLSLRWSWRWQLRASTHNGSSASSEHRGEPGLICLFAGGLFDFGEGTGSSQRSTHNWRSESSETQRWGWAELLVSPGRGEGAGRQGCCSCPAGDCSWLFVIEDGEGLGCWIMWRGRAWAVLPCECEGLGSLVQG